MNTDTTNIAGKVVVITGASSGLGEAAARYLSERGAIVVLGARRVERIEALAAEITGNGGQALALATDVTDAAQVQLLVDAAAETFGRVDVMLNNAGLMPLSPVKAEAVSGPISDYYERNAIPADSFARCVLFAVSQPDDVDVNEILFRPTKQEL